MNHCMLVLLVVLIAIMPHACADNVSLLPDNYNLLAALHGQQDAQKMAKMQWQVCGWTTLMNGERLTVEVKSTETDEWFSLPLLDGIEKGDHVRLAVSCQSWNTHYGAPYTRSMARPNNWLHIAVGQEDSPKIPSFKDGDKVWVVCQYTDIGTPQEIRFYKEKPNAAPRDAEVGSFTFRERP